MPASQRVQLPTHICANVGDANAVVRGQCVHAGDELPGLWHQASEFRVLTQGPTQQLLCMYKRFTLHVEPAQCACRLQHTLRTHVVGWVAVWEATVPRVHRRVVSNQQQQQLARWVVRASHTRLEAMVACGTIPITVRAIEYLGWHA